MSSRKGEYGWTLAQRMGGGRRGSATTVRCRAPWGGPVLRCEIHDSAWPSGAYRCDIENQRLGIRSLGGQK